MDVTETRYAKTADGVHIAYQVAAMDPWTSSSWRGAGSGRDLARQTIRPLLRRLASFSRLILFDRRGTGLSDHVLDRMQQISLENRMEDVRAVMDAADSTRAMVLALEGGGGGFPVAAMFAATLPERTAGLIAYGAAARALWAPDYPFGTQPEDFDADVAELERAWVPQSWRGDGWASCTRRRKTIRGRPRSSSR